MDLWNGDVVIWDKSSKLYNPITLEMKHLVDLLELLKEIHLSEASMFTHN